MAALLIIDVQNDFISGSLKVRGAEEIIQDINTLKKDKQFNLVVLSQDSHPSNHISFKSNNDAQILQEIDLEYNGVRYKQIMWPDHCIKDSFGEEFHPLLEMDNKDIIIKKGENNMIDSYSAFYDNLKFNKTELDDILKKQNIKDVYICGLAFDYCVKFTALDATDLGYNVYMIKDLTRSINPNMDEENIREMEGKNITFL